VIPAGVVIILAAITALLAALFVGQKVFQMSIKIDRMEAKFAEFERDFTNTLLR